MGDLLVVLALVLHFGNRKSIDIRGGLLLVLGSVFVLFCGPRWSRTSRDTRGELLFSLVLVS